MSTPAGVVTVQDGCEEVVDRPRYRLPGQAGDREGEEAGRPE